MKKFFKTLLIIVLVIASIAGTIYLFYKNLTKRQDSFAYISDFSVSSGTTEFSDKLTKAKEFAGTRAILLEQTNANLQDMTDILGGYLINAKSFKIDENGIIAKLSNAESKMANADYQLEQYIWKCIENNKLGASFDKDKAFNASYIDISGYIIKMGEFVSYLNNCVQTMLVDADMDVKFAIIEMYTIVCIETFKSLTDTQNVSVKDAKNINFFNENIDFNNGYLTTSNTNGDFTINNNNFLSAYVKCDRLKLAQNIALNVESVNSINESSSNEAKATYYLKQILGI